MICLDLVVFVLYVTIVFNENIIFGILFYCFPIILPSPVKNSIHVVGIYVIIPIRPVNLRRVIARARLHTLLDPIEASGHRSPPDVKI